MRVEVVAIDGSTGSPLDGVPARVVPEFGPEATLLAGSGTGPDVAVHRTGRVRLSVTVEPPRGFGGRTTQRIFDEVARGAARVRVAVPLYPEFVVSLRAVDEGGRPVAGVRATEAAFGDARFDFEDRPHEGVDNGFFTDPVEFTSDTSGADGVVTLRLPGVPFERFAVRVAVPLPDGEPSRVRTMLTGIVRDISPDANARGAADVVLRNVAWIHGGGVWGTGHAIGCGFTSKPPPAPPTSLVVRVLRRDGRPAAGVQVRAAWTWRETGEDGTARFEGLKEGPVDVVAGARGFLASALRAEIGRDAEVVVRESPPRTARVTVTDVTGRPIPAARITARSEFLPGSDRDVASHGAIALIDGDCDVITPMTGRDGTLSLLVPAGRVKYYASVGGASESVVSADDEVRIVVTKPVRPPPAK